MNDDQEMLHELEQALRERRQQGFQVLIDLHGGLQGWLDACRVRKATDKDYGLARAIVRLLGRGGSERCAGLMAGERRRLNADPDVAAYWQSVEDAGDDGWREERERIRNVERLATKTNSEHGHLLMLDVYAARSLMPTYRAWGRILIEAGLSNEPSTHQRVPM